MSYCLGLAFIITGLFCLIRFYTQLETQFIFFFSLVIVQVYILMLFEFSLVLKVRLLSECYYKTFQEKDLTRSKVEDTFWKSCLPLEWSVGNMFTIASRNFCLQIFGATIFETVVSLILTY